jgi:D-galactose 1-dehydrogenase
MARIRIGVIGLGKIAQDQHLPVIAAAPEFELAAVASQRGLAVPGARAFRDADALLRDMPDLDAVSICSPPGPRYAIARKALAAGRHVMLEKPPTATVAELSDLAAEAARTGRVLMTTWHSQYNAAVDAARDLLAGERVSRMAITWKEDVRKWHPGQDWVWQPGGFGVCDPGINALSIAVKILPAPIFVSEATLLVPRGAQTPIAARLRFATRDNGSADLRAEFDWRQEGDELWNIEVQTGSGKSILLSRGGSRLEVDGRIVAESQSREYEAIYGHFARLLADGRSHVDARPLELVADSFLLGRQVPTDPFSW